MLTASPASAATRQQQAPASAPSAPQAPEMLHPNLARIAVAYDQVVAAYQAGQLDEQTALARIRKLRARDDQGVIWALRQDGVWVRQTRDGNLVPDTPPTAGIPATSPFHVSPENYRSTNPDRFIARPDTLGYNDPTADRHARVSASPSAFRRFMSWPRRRFAVASAALALAAMLLVANGVSSDSPSPDAVSSSPAAVTTIVVES